ncbi:MAG: hypothetical protein ACRBB0_08895 [Pelagimonas sp.]|uniref:hypothetical protein n=1 Tax=Pelagimonas sp. TaxID=2073170 RepID=UPI003D6AE311
MIKVPPKLQRLITSIALIFAMVASGFAHSGARTGVSDDLAAYVAAGGWLGDICGDVDDPKGTQGQKCEACRLIGAALVPPHDIHCTPIVTDETRRFNFVAKRLHQARSLDLARLTRAPPQA